MWGQEVTVNSKIVRKEVVGSIALLIQRKRFLNEDKSVERKVLNIEIDKT